MKSTKSHISPKNVYLLDNTFWVVSLFNSLNVINIVDTINSDSIIKKNQNISGIIINALGGFDALTENNGIKWLHSLRNEQKSCLPVIIYSLEPFVNLSRDFPILKTPGIQFIQLPFVLNDFVNLIESTFNTLISEEQRKEVVRWNCGLQNDWLWAAHQLKPYIQNYQQHYLRVREIVDQWAKSISQYAPDQKYNLEAFQSLLRLNPDKVNIEDLIKTQTILEDGLQNKPNTDEIINFKTTENIPDRPPKGFSKILIADDEPQDSIINLLRNDYGYTVLNQAWKLSQAKQMLDREEPNVVCSDFFFKESERKTEIPDKSVGDAFIKYSLNHPVKPLVLVTSSSVLRSDTDIRYGAINCSGSIRSTAPHIHATIWEEAHKRGVYEQESSKNEVWSLENNCRQKLDAYLLNLRKYAKQWKEFKETIEYTLNQADLILKKSSSDENAIVYQLIEILKPIKEQKLFSIEKVESIYEDVENIQNEANTPPKSDIKAEINILLHGKIAQFSRAKNELISLLPRLRKIGDDLQLLSQYKLLGQKLNHKIDEFDSRKELNPYLDSLQEIVAEAIEQLPPLPVLKPNDSQKSKSFSKNKVKIFVIEDTAYWRDVVIEGIEKAKSRLGKNFHVNFQHFDNAGDALASIPAIHKSHAIDASNDQEEEKVIAIVDICLPENRQHAEKIRASLQGKGKGLAMPHSKHGLNLISNLCSYKFNIPVIVFSTIDSIEDRLTICQLGVPDYHYLAKEYDDENAIAQALERIIQKKGKYVIKRLDKEDGAKAKTTFFIDGIEIPFTKELIATFQALYDLKEDNQMYGKSSFSAREIFERRQLILGRELSDFSDTEKRKIHDYINRIRNLILKIFQKNNRFIDVRGFLKTRENVASDEFIHSSEEDFDDEFSYELNASFKDEDDEPESCKILVIENDNETLDEIILPLESLNGYEVKFATNVEDAVAISKEFKPHLICLDLQIPYTKDEFEDGSMGNEFAGLDAWEKIRAILPDAGVIVPTANSDKNYLIAKASQMGIPIRNFVSKKNVNWINLFLTKVNQQKREILLGEVTTSTYDFHEPIIEILDGSDLSKGILQLTVNNNPIKIKKGSSIAKVIGLLLTIPHTFIDFDDIKQKIGGIGPATIDEKKGWTKGIRDHIRDNWLPSQEFSDGEVQSKKILVRSEGLCLNVQVFDLRISKQ